MLRQCLLRHSPWAQLAVLLACAVTSAGQDIQPAVSASATEKPPISVGILIDSSVVRWGGPSLAKSAVTNFLRSLREEDDYALFTAADRFHIEQEFTDEVDAASTALDHLASKDKAAVYDATIDALRFMGSAVTNDRKALLLLTSGEEGSSRAGVTEVIAAAKQANVPLFIVAVPAGTWRDRVELPELARATGGRALMPAKKSEVMDICEAAGRTLMGPPRIAAGTGNNRKPLAGYAELIVRSAPVANLPQTSAFRPADSVQLEKMLVSRLQEKHLFSRLTDATGTTGEDLGQHTAPVAPRTTLELLPSIVAFKPGNHLKRGTAGLLGSGVARVKVQFVLRDAATRKPILAFVKEGVGPSGLLGGDDERNEMEAMLRAARSAVEEIQRNR